MTTEARTAGICEAHPGLRAVLTRALTQAGFATTAVGTGTAALQRFAARPPDVLIVGVELPDTDGREVARALRARGVRAPVLFTADSPGHDTVVKPFALAELLVRVGALTAAPRPGAPVQTQLDPATRSLVAAGGRADLTPTEFRLLTLLDARRGELIAREELAAAGWPEGAAAVSANTLDAYAARIRRKLREAGAPESLRTRRGVGYELR